jgi:autophagy-related protein 5
MSTFRPSGAQAVAYGTELFRRLVWEGTVPLEIKIDSKELPAGSDRTLESTFIQAPRISYLPLLLPDIRRYLTELILDEREAKNIKEEEWWFEDNNGGLIKWHWPIGLLYDLQTASRSTKAAAASAATGSASAPPRPLQLILHLVSPPSEKLLMSPTGEACKQAFMSLLKEADFLRWGTTKRVTSLRKADQDQMWEDIKDHKFEGFWRVASKITPTNSPQQHGSTNQPGHHARSQTSEPAGAPDRDSAYSVRNIPVRIYLPENGPVLQELIPPILEDGRANTIENFLETSLPLLFPRSPEEPLAYALVQGIILPPEAEMAWLGACLSGPDGWVCVCIGLGRPS